MLQLARLSLLPILGVDQSSLDSGGTVDDHIQNVFFWIFWVSVVVGVLVAGAILYACFRFRRRSDDEMPRQIHGNNKLEIAWTVTPLVILISLFVVSSLNMNYIINAPSYETTASGAKHVQVNVTVVGQQFAWTYYYNDQNNKPMENGSGQLLTTQACDPSVDQDAPTASCLYVPANTPINLSVVSSDPLPLKNGTDQCSINPDSTDPAAKAATARLNQLINDDHETLAQAISTEGCGVDHSFFIPTLGGQINAIPGQVNNMWFDARLDNGRMTEYFGQCTELCGVGHAQMLIEVIALPYNQWSECASVAWTPACLKAIAPNPNS